jgi:hypothetical protein
MFDNSIFLSTVMPRLISPRSIIVFIGPKSSLNEVGAK